MFTALFLFQVFYKMHDLSMVLIKERAAQFNKARRIVILNSPASRTKNLIRFKIGLFPYPTAFEIQQATRRTPGVLWIFLFFTVYIIPFIFECTRSFLLKDLTFFLFFHESVTSKNL